MKNSVTTCGAHDGRSSMPAPEGSAAQVRQPRALWALIALKTCDSFGYLGLRGLLIIYLTTVLRMVDRTAFDIVGGFLALSYLTPVVGGLVADRWMSCWSVACAGALLTMLGYLWLAASAATVGIFTGLQGLVVGLACIAAGNGFIKASVMTLVGRLYVPRDSRREAGFSLGYMGMNVGQLLSAILSSLVAYRWGWPFAFALLALSSGLGLLILISRVDASQAESPAPIRRSMRSGAGAAAVPITVAACATLLFQRAALGWILAAALPVTAMYIIRRSVVHGSQRDRINVRWAIVLAIFAAVGWTFVEQAAGSLNLLALRHLPRTFLHLTIAAPQ